MIHSPWAPSLPPGTEQPGPSRPIQTPPSDSMRQVLGVGMGNLELVEALPPSPDLSSAAVNTCCHGAHSPSLPLEPSSHRILPPSPDSHPFLLLSSLPHPPLPFHWPQQPIRTWEAGLSLPRRGSAAPCDHVAQTCQGTQSLPWPSQPPCSPPSRNGTEASSGSFACPPLSIPGYSRAWHIHEVLQQQFVQRMKEREFQRSSG